MGKGSTKSEVQHTRTLPDGRIGCYGAYSCQEPATRWIDMERYGIRRWLSTSCCDNHGEELLNNPDHTMRVRPINQ